MKKLAILGSTGSIGLSTLAICREHRERFSVECLSAHANVKRLLDQIKEFRPQKAFVTGREVTKLEREVALQYQCELIDCQSELLKNIEQTDYDIVMLAIMGAAGLSYGIVALETGKKLAIANKEPLVIAGHLFNVAASKGQGMIIPVDSEHSAIFQCLQGNEKHQALKRIILTSSGGPFHNYTHEQFEDIVPEKALKHPTWEMGQKITIDSSTMMNKALEVIEAKWLFSVDVDQIDVTVHRQSIVHSMVEYIDGSVLAQLGHTDMRYPIFFALTFPDRIHSGLPSLDFQDKLSLTFEPLNPFLSKAIDLAKACSKDDVSPVLMNAANEIFVEFFLKGTLSFKRVYPLLEEVIEVGLNQGFRADSLDSIQAIDQFAREKTKSIILS